MTQATQDPPPAVHGAPGAQASQNGEAKEDEKKAKSHTPVDDGRAKSPRKRRKVNHGKALPYIRPPTTCVADVGILNSACIYCRRSVSFYGLSPMPNCLLHCTLCFTAGCEYGI